MLPFLDIENRGTDIVKTNFFDSEYARNGCFFISTKHDCVV